MEDARSELYNSSHPLTRWTVFEWLESKTWPSEALFYRIKWYVVKQFLTSCKCSSVCLANKHQMKLEKMLITKLPGLFFTFGKNHLCNKTISDETYLKIECFFPKGRSETSRFRWAKTYFEWDQISQNDTILNSCSPYHTIKRNILLKYFGHFKSKYRKDEDIYLNTSFHIPMDIYISIYICIFKCTNYSVERGTQNRNRSHRIFFRYIITMTLQGNCISFHWLRLCLLFLKIS